MTFWFFVLGVPLFGYGLFTVVWPQMATRFLQTFPRNRVAGAVLCAAALALCMGSLVSDSYNPFLYFRF